MGVALWSIIVPTANIHDRSDPLFTPSVAHATAPDAHVHGPRGDTFWTQLYGRLKPVRTTHAPNWWDLFKARNRDSYVDSEDAGALLSAGDAHQHAVAREHLVFGEDLGDFLDENVGGFTRCAASAFAVITYFCGADAAHAVYDPLLSMVMAEVGAGALRRQLGLLRKLQQEHPQGLMPQAVFHLDITDSEDRGLGHVWALHMMPDGSGQLYMSYIQKYTLRQYLTGKGARPLSPSALDAFVDTLEVLENASHGAWGQVPMSAYHAAFNVMLYNKERAGNVTLASHLACVVPPWNGTAADPQDPTHDPATAALGVVTEGDLRGWMEAMHEGHAAAAGWPGQAEPEERRSARPGGWGKAMARARARARAREQAHE